MHGDRRRLDTGSVNGERFTVMGGARPASKKLRIKVHPGSVTVRVPAEGRE